MFSKFFSRKSGKPGKAVSYEDAKSLAKDGNEEERADLATRTDLKPEILYFLAEDPSPKVRGRIAANTAAPRQADLLLAGDMDESVRGSLAEKIVRVAPGLTADEQDKLRQLTYDALAMLAKDQAVRIRQTLAEALKEVTDAPPEVIRRLAWDVEAAVSTPVLRFSPVLTDQDLVEIIRAKPSPDSISAISQRDGVSEKVSDAIVESDDENGIALLLKNTSAQIREETLDKILDRAVDVGVWHMPLAMRPKLPSAAAVKIARFVAEDILKRIAARNDLNASTLQAVRTVVHKRLGDAEAVFLEEEDGPRGDSVGVRVDDDEAFDWASKLWAEGKLSEETFLDAVGKSRKKAVAILAVMSDLPIRVVERSLDLKSAKGCVSITWRAGMKPSTAEIVQTKLAGVASKSVLREEEGGFPLEEDEMKWQIDFMTRLL